MTIDTRPRCAVIYAPEGYDRTSLSPVAANLVMEGAVQARADDLEHAFGSKGVEEAMSLVGQNGLYLRANSISDSLAKLKEFQATDPFKNDYPDVKAQRSYALAEVIAEAEESNRLTAPEFTQRVAAIVTSALVWQASNGSLEAADVLLSDHVSELWQSATGNPEVPEDIFPTGSVVILSA